MSEVVFIKRSTSELDYHFIWAEWLNSGALIDSATVTCTDADITITGTAINASTITIDDVDYAAGKVVSCLISGGDELSEYEIVCAITTDEANPLSEKASFKISIRDE